MNIRLQKREELRLCGYSVETSLATSVEDITRLWGKFMATGEGSADPKAEPTNFYGLMWSTEGERYCYLISKESSLWKRSEEGTVRKVVPAGEFAVASIPALHSSIDAWTEFYEEALAKAGLQPAPGHVYDFEYYPQGDNGDYELWTPVVRL